MKTILLDSIHKLHFFSVPTLSNLSASYRFIIMRSFSKCQEPKISDHYYHVRDMLYILRLFLYQFPPFGWSSFAMFDGLLARVLLALKQLSTYDIYAIVLLIVTTVRYLAFKLIFEEKGGIYSRFQFSLPVSRWCGRKDHLKGYFKNIMHFYK